MPLQDIGDGFQQISIGAPEKEQSTQGAMSLLELAQRIQGNQRDAAKDALDIQIKNHQIRNQWVQDSINHWQMIKAKNDEIRAQKKSHYERIMGLQEDFAKSPELAQISLQEQFPGAVAIENKDGTWGIKLPGGRVANINPRRISDPKVRADTARGLEKDWVTSSAEYNIKSQAFVNIKQAIFDGTGAGEVKALYNGIKAIEPGAANAVKEGETMLVKSVNPIVANMQNMYNSLVTGEVNTIFGDKNSPRRQEWLNEVEEVYLQEQAKLVDKGRHLHRLAVENGVELRLSPVGDLPAEFTERLNTYGSDDDAANAAVDFSRAQHEKVLARTTESRTKAGINRVAQQVGDDTLATSTQRPKPQKASVFPSSEKKKATPIPPMPTDLEPLNYLDSLLKGDPNAR